MQAGFAMLEAGIVQPKNATNILFKNMIDASLAALCYWLLGYGIAFGTSKDGFIGSDTFAIGLTESINNTDHGWQAWFFQWAFAATASTIDSGVLAERLRFTSYCALSIFMTMISYPYAAYHVWHDE